MPQPDKSKQCNACGAWTGIRIDRVTVTCEGCGKEHTQPVGGGFLKSRRIRNIAMIVGGFEPRRMIYGTNMEIVRA